LISCRWLSSQSVTSAEDDGLRDTRFSGGCGFGMGDGDCTATGGSTCGSEGDRARALSSEALNTTSRFDPNAVHQMPPHLDKHDRAHAALLTSTTTGNDSAPRELLR
jgi:hypothetical protein